MMKCANIYSYVRRPLVIYDFATAPLRISLYMRKVSFSFLSVQTQAADRQKDKWTDRQLTDRQDDRERTTEGRDREPVYPVTHFLYVSAHFLGQDSVAFPRGLKKLRTLLQKLCRFQTGIRCVGLGQARAGTFKQSRGTRNQVGIGLSYRSATATQAAGIHSLESIPKTFQNTGSRR